MHIIEVYMGGSPSPEGQCVAGKRPANTKSIGSQVNPRTSQDVMSKISCHCGNQNFNIYSVTKHLRTKLPQDYLLKIFLVAICKFLFIIPDWFKDVVKMELLTFWHRNYFFLILAHPVY